MPRKTTRRRVGRRRRFLRRRGLRRVRRGKALTITKQIGGVADRFFSKFAMSVEQTIAFNASGSNLQLLKLNSVITPYGAEEISNVRFYLGSSSASGAPTGVYLNYIVHACHISISYATVADSTGVVLPLLVVVPLPAGASTYSGNGNALVETPYSVSRSFGRTLANGNTLNKGNIIRKTYYVRSLAGIPRKTSLRTDENFIGSYNGDPTTIYRLGIWTATSGAGSPATDATLQVGFRIKAIYMVEFFNRNNVNLSGPA